MCVSIAMTTFHGAKYLRTQLDSILNQTIRPHEIMICDDKSSDDTVAVIEKFQSETDVAVHLIVNEQRLGYRENFRKAANLCSGAYIAFCDQDDFWLPNKLECSIAAMEREDALLSIHAYIPVNSSEPDITPPKHRARRAFATTPFEKDPRAYGLGFSIVFHRQLLAFDQFWDSSKDFFDPQFKEAHDQWFFGLAAGLGKVAYCSEPLVLYRQHSANTAGAPRPTKTIGAALRKVRGHKEALTVELSSFRAREAIFLEIGRGEGPYQQRALETAADYAGLCGYLEDRIRCINAPDKRDRLTSFARMATNGFYQNLKFKGHPRSAMAKDFLSAIMSK